MFNDSDEYVGGGRPERCEESPFLSAGYVLDFEDEDLDLGSPNKPLRDIACWCS